MKNGKRRTWTTDDVRTLKTLARKKTRAGKIAKQLKRTEGATRKKPSVWGYRSTLASSFEHWAGSRRGAARSSFSFGV